MRTDVISRWDGLWSIAISTANTGIWKREERNLKLFSPKNYKISTYFTCIKVHKYSEPCLKWKRSYSWKFVACYLECKRKHIVRVCMLASCNNVKVKHKKLSLCSSKQTPHHETVQGSRCMAPPLLMLALDGGEWSASCHGHFTSQGRAQYPLNRRLGGHHSQSGHCGEEKNALSQPGLEPYTCSSLPYYLSYPSTIISIQSWRMR
jgi:hypothetical protein